MILPRELYMDLLCHEHTQSIQAEFQCFLPPEHTQSQYSVSIAMA